MNEIKLSTKIEDLVWQPCNQSLLLYIQAYSVRHEMSHPSLNIEKIITHKDYLGPMRYDGDMTIDMSSPRHLDVVK